jgi:hypothetical protein
LENTVSKKALSIFILCILLSIFTLPVFLLADTFDLSLSLVEGGTRLELNQANQYKGVKLQVNSDVSTRYEIIQRIQQQFVNRDNPGVILRDNLVVRGLRGTNRFGTFRIPTNDIAVRDNELIYTSSSSGQADTLTLVYGLKDLDSIQPGFYQGQISFTLRPIGSTRQEVTKYLYIYISISETGTVSQKIEIITPTGSKRINLNPSKDQMIAVDILVKIDSDFNEPFSIVQYLARPLESKTGDRIDSNIINFRVAEAKKGVGAAKTDLSNNPQIIYTSSPTGQADREFIISYYIKDLSDEKSGTYNSRLQFYLRKKGIDKKIDDLDLAVENEKIFELSLEPQDPKGRIEFSNLKPKSLPQQSEVIVDIKSNTGKKYQVSQKVFSDLTNKEGNVISPEYFTLKTENIDLEGDLKFLSKANVQKGETVLYVSDAKGSAGSFKVIYELTCPADIVAGDYSTRITYSLVEL